MQKNQVGINFLIRAELLEITLEIEWGLWEAMKNFFQFFEKKKKITHHSIDEKNHLRANGGGSKEQQIWPLQGANFCDTHRDKYLKCYKKSIKSNNVVIAIGNFM